MLVTLILRARLWASLPTLRTRHMGSCSQRGSSPRSTFQVETWSPRRHGVLTLRATSSASMFLEMPRAYRTRTDSSQPGTETKTRATCRTKPTKNASAVAGEQCRGHARRYALGGAPRSKGASPRHCLGRPPAHSALAPRPEYRYVQELESVRFSDTLGKTLANVPASGSGCSSRGRDARLTSTPARSSDCRRGRPCSS